MLDALKAAVKAMGLDAKTIPAGFAGDEPGRPTRSE
jgi:hypothetical protein